MAARAYYDAVGKETLDGLYRALLGAALIDPDRFHRCVSFCAHSLRGAYNYGQTEYDTVILEDHIDKVQLVYYLHGSGARPRHSKYLYGISPNQSVHTYNADSIRGRWLGSSIITVSRECSFDKFWALLE
jgi:hypothetical protein